MDVEAILAELIRERQQIEEAECIRPRNEADSSLLRTGLLRRQMTRLARRL
jgi:hypothetical protein